MSLADNFRIFVNENGLPVTRYKPELHTSDGRIIELPHVRHVEVHYDADDATRVVVEFLVRRFEQQVVATALADEVSE